MLDWAINVLSLVVATDTAVSAHLGAISLVPGTPINTYGRDSTIVDTRVLQKIQE